MYLCYTTNKQTQIMKTQNIANRAHLKRLIAKGLIEARRKYCYTDDYAYDAASGFGEMKEWATARLEDDANEPVDGVVTFDSWDLGTQTGYVRKRGDNLWTLAIHSNHVWEIRFKAQPAPAPKPEPVVEKSQEVAEVQIIYSRKNADKPKIFSSRDAFAVLEPLFADCIDHREKFCILLVDRANRVLGWHLVGVGGLGACVVDPKVIMQAAILANASGIILAHNHPSGNDRPSEGDMSLTNRIKQVASLLEIKVLDHLIMTSEKYLSFADQGMI